MMDKTLLTSHYPTMTAVLLKAIKQSGQSLYSIAQSTGMDKAALGRFLAGKQSLRLNIADKLAAHFGLNLARYQVLFHTTTETAQTAIISEGFRDGEGHYMTSRLHRGVWLSDRPLNGCDGAPEEAFLLLVLLSMSDAELRKYEWIEECKSYREFLVPASVINRRAELLLPTLGVVDMYLPGESRLMRRKGPLWRHSVLGRRVWPTAQRFARATVKEW
jgi:transcriptional regulator with XRE-family HTH domain